jgi:hypothetical protein
MATKSFSIGSVEQATGKVLSLLILGSHSEERSSLSMKIQIMGGKITENVLFSFQILLTKVDIFYFNHFLISCSNN